jgi:hypothetical protein
MWMEPVHQAFSVLTALGMTVAGTSAALMLKRSRQIAISEQMKQCLEKHHDYFNYLSASIDRDEPLLPPPDPLPPMELKVVQAKLLEWIESIDGEYRGKLTVLCREMGLVELELRRLRSPRRGIRMEAAYHLGVMRAAECTGELLKLLELEGSESTAFVIGRAAAKCAESSEELFKLLQLLTEYHPDAHELIADTIASASLDTTALFAELIHQRQAAPAPLAVALISLSGRNEQEVLGQLDRLLLSESKEVRIRAAKLLLQHSHRLPLERIDELIRHPDREIRTTAVQAVGEINRLANWARISS